MDLVITVSASFNLDYKILRMCFVYINTGLYNPGIIQ